MPVANLAVLVKLTGGFLPPNSRAGDIEIYDNGLLRIFESDTEVVERQIGRQKVLDILRFARDAGFFELQSVFHDEGSATAPDVTLSLTDSAGSLAVTATAYQKLRGEVRKNPFDVVYKYITNIAWESYNNPQAQVSPVSDANMGQSASQLTPVAPQPPKPQLPELAFRNVPPQPLQAVASEPSTVFDKLPSINDLFESAKTQDDAGVLPPLPVQTAPQVKAVQAPSVPKIPMQNQDQGHVAVNAGNVPTPLPKNSGQVGADSGAKAGAPSLPPLDAILGARSNTSAQTPPQGSKQSVPRPPEVTSPPKNDLQKGSAQQQAKTGQQGSGLQSQVTKLPVQGAKIPNQGQTQQGSQNTQRQKDGQPSKQQPPQQTVKQPQPQEDKRMVGQEQEKKLQGQARDVRGDQRDVPAQKSQEQNLEVAQREQEDELKVTEKDERSGKLEKGERMSEQQNQKNTSQARQQITGQPQKNRQYSPPIAWRATQRLIERMETALSAKVLVIYVAESHSLDFEDGQSLYAHLRKFGRKKHLCVIPVISGADITAVWRIASMLREYCQEMTVFVPERSSVATTLLALSADRVMMNAFGYLNPIESEFSHPLLTDRQDQGTILVPIRDILNIYSSGEQSSSALRVDPLVLMSAKRHHELLRTIAENLLQMSKAERSDEQKKQLVVSLMTGYPTPDYPITYAEASKIGLPLAPVNDELNDFFEELLANYDYVAQPFVEVQQGYHITHRQLAMIETLGRRTILYEERMTSAETGEVVEEHVRWRQLTEETTVSAEGKEHSNLKWTELALLHRED